MATEKLSLADLEIEQLLIERSKARLERYRDKIQKIREDVCPSYEGVPKNVVLGDRNSICNSCTDSSCYKK